MYHHPIQIQHVSFILPQKTCFEDFSTNIQYGEKIAIIGRNGSGKSTLLKMLQDKIVPMPSDINIGYVAQVIEDFLDLSGGQRFNAALTGALKSNPNLLLLDEPTNHLDRSNRQSLLRMLRSYHGTLIVISHDVELLRHSVDKIWHIDNGKIQIFSGNYDDYIAENHLKKSSIEQELAFLDRKKKEMHQSLMKEQQRASNSKASGQKNIEKRKWPTIVSKAKAGRAEETSGHKKAAIDHKKQDLTDKLVSLRLPEVIKPKFLLNAADIGNKITVSITDGSIGYGNKKFLDNINFLLDARGRIAITGDNGCGKTTLLKAILDDSKICREGIWQVPKSEDIGYLDQHYATLNHSKTVVESIQTIVPNWIYSEIRRHLNDFLFRKNEEVIVW